jgi:hypothetical protein
MRHSNRVPAARPSDRVVGPRSGGLWVCGNGRSIAALSTAKAANEKVLRSLHFFGLFNIQALAAR